MDGLSRNQVTHMFLSKNIMVENKCMKKLT